MNKKMARGLLFLVLSFSASFVMAQNVDHRILGIESGVVLGYDVTTGNIGNATSLTLNLSLTDNLTSGFEFLSGSGTMPATASLLSLSYGVADRFGMSILVGRDTGAGVLLAGVGMYVNIFERRIQDAISTILKAKIDYIFPPTAANGVTSGDLTMGLSVSVGL